MTIFLIKFVRNFCEEKEKPPVKKQAGVLFFDFYNIYGRFKENVYKLVS